MTRGFVFSGAETSAAKPPILSPAKLPVKNITRDFAFFCIKRREWKTLKVPRRNAEIMENKKATASKSAKNCKNVKNEAQNKAAQNKKATAKNASDRSASNAKNCK